MMNQNASPTSQLLMDYEEHLRNTLEKGLDAESYSLHTFESLLTRSMENLGESIDRGGNSNFNGILVFSSFVSIGGIIVAQVLYNLCL